jgi:hypothetical protein
MAYFEGEIPVVTTGTTNGNNGWNDWSWIIGLALVGGLFGGWGNGGFGFGGNRGGYGGVGENYVLATDFATIERKLDSISNGICDSTFALNNTINNGFFGVQNSLTQGFSGLNTALLQGNYALSSQLADCCCKTNLAIQDVKYANERQTCDIITAINAGNQRLIDIYTSDKISALQAENSGLKAQISNDRQSAFIIDALAPKCPQPAYVVQPPQQVTFPTNCCGNVAYANYNTGCSGCGNSF